MTRTPVSVISESQLQQMAAEIHQAIPGAEVRLFGSHARGEATADSDVDLMIIVTDAWYATHNWFETLGLLWRKLAHHRVPIDLLLCPRSKVEERRHWLSQVIALAQRERSRLPWVQGKSFVDPSCFPSGFSSPMVCARRQGGLLSSRVRQGCPPSVSKNVHLSPLGGLPSWKQGDNSGSCSARS